MTGSERGSARREKSRCRRPGGRIVALVLPTIFTAAVFLYSFFLSLWNPSTAGSAAFAAEEGLGLPEIRKLYVPAEEVVSWPKSYEPIGSEVFEQLYKSAAPATVRPNPAGIVHARYSARVLGETLSEGQFDAEIRRTEDAAALIDLEPLNLKVSTLRWLSTPTTSLPRNHSVGTNEAVPAAPGQRSPVVATRPLLDAVWGTSEGGRTFLLANQAGTQLTGSWRHTGRRTGKGTEFDVRVAPATVTEIELLVPESKHLRASVGDVTGPLPSNEPSWKIWRVGLGNRTATRIEVNDSRLQGDIPPQIYFDQELSCTIRQEGMQLQLRINAEIYNSPTNEIHLTLPASVDVETVTYGGVETALAWDAQPNGSKQQVRVRLPEPILGQTRAIRIDGFAPARFDQQWTLPQVTVEHGVFLSGLLRLVVERPLQLRSFNEEQDYRTAAAVSTTPETETFQFRQLTQNASLSVEIARPRLGLSAHVTSHLSIESDTWKADSDIDWHVTSGSAFELQCVIPPGWEISTVVPRTENSVITNWEVATEKEGSRILSLELLEAIDSEHPKAMRIVATRVPLPAGETLAVPLVQPLDCTTIDHWVIATHPPTVAADTTVIEAFRTIPETELPKSLLESPLWKEVVSQSDNKRLILNAMGERVKGAVSFETRERPIRARSVLRMDLSPQEVKENILVSVSPDGEAVNSLYVFLTAAGPPFQWSLQYGSDVLPIEPRRLPGNYEARWSLPVGGELWEFRLPVSLSQDFRLSGNRSGALPGEKTVSLPVVPGAKDFSGKVEVLATSDIDVESETAGMHAAETESRDAGIPEFPRGAQQTRRSWTFVSPRDALNLRIGRTVGSESAPKFATLRLHSSLAASGSGNDIHTAEFFIDPDSQPGMFRFRLPAEVALLGVRISGQTVRAARQNDEFVLPPLPRRTQNIVEVRYRVAARQAWLRDLRDIPVPVTNHDILKVHWDFVLPSGFQLANEPQGVRLQETISDFTWNERLFGPLGRSADASTFNPFRVAAWRDLLMQPSDPVLENTDSINPQDEFVFDNASDLESRTSRRHWHAESLSLPESLSLSILHRTRSRLVGWMLLLFCLTIGIFIRKREFLRRWQRTPGDVSQNDFVTNSPSRHTVSPRARWRYALLSVLLVSAVTAPAFYGFLAGACLCGFVLSAVVPVRWFENLFVVQRDPRGIPLGSTAALPRGSVPMALLICGTVALSGHAQPSPRSSVDSLSRETTPTAAVSSGAPKKLADRYSVLIPTTPDDKPAAGKESLLYVPQELLAGLRRLASERSKPSPAYLMTSANYAVVIDGRQSATVEARYKIALVAPDRPMRIYLPITNTNLDAPDGCLIDGKSHPVLTVPGKPGYLIEWNQPANSSREHTEFLDVRLRLFPRPSSMPGNNEFQIGIPPVATAQATLRFGDTNPPAQLTFGANESRLEQSAGLYTADAGRLDRLVAVWSNMPDRAQAELETDVIRFVTVHPSWLEYRYRISCRILRGFVDHLALRVPGGAVVRSVGEGLAHNLEAAKDTAEPGRLTVFFAESRRSAFSFDLTLMMPVADPSRDIPIRLVAPFGTESQGEVTKTALNEVGLSAAPEFRLATMAGEAERFGTLSADSPLKKEALAIGVREPELGFRIFSNDEMHVRLVPMSPSRKIVQSHQQGTITSSRLDWKLTAEIRTENAGAFVHEMTIDPRLKIESVSVQQDGVERLARAARDGERLILFLRDRTTAVQDVVLTGSMPLAMSQTISLPTVRFNEAQPGESLLSISRDPDVTAEIIMPDGTSLTKRAEPDPVSTKTIPLLERSKVSTTEPLPTLRILPRNEQVRVDTATFVSTPVDGPAVQSTVLRFTYSETRWPRLHLHIPREVGFNYQISAPRLETETEMRDDGAVNIALKPTDDSVHELLITINANLAAVLPNEWRLPRIGTPNLLQGDHFLLVSTNQPMRPAEDFANAVSLASLPQWVTNATPLPLASQTWEAYKALSATNPGPWVLSFALDRAANTRLRVPIVRTFIDAAGDGREWGLSEAVVLDASSRQLEWQLPTGTSPRAVFVNGRPGILPPTAKKVAIPLDAGNHPQRVVFYWIHERSSNAWSAGAREFELPRLAEQPEKELLEAAIPNNRWLARFSVESVASKAEQTAAAAEGLLEAARFSASNAAAMESLRPVLLRLRDAARQSLAELPAEPTNSSQETEAFLLQRLQTAITRIDDFEKKLSGTVLPANGVKEDSALFAGGLSPLQEPSNGRILRASIPRGAASQTAMVWSVPITVVRILSAIAGFSALLFAGRHLGRSSWTGKSLRLSKWSGIVLGAVWWVWLAPSVLGLVILLASAVAVFRGAQLSAPSRNRHDSFELTT